MDIFGIEPMIRGVMNCLFRSHRGSGRTSNMLKLVEDGDTIVFSNMQEANRIKYILLTMKKDVTTIVCSPKKLDELFNRLYGRNTGKIIFDHEWLEKYYINTFENASSMLSRFQKELDKPNSMKERQESIWSNF